MPHQYNIALFGASGFIGSNLTQYFKRQKRCRLIGISRSEADLTKPESTTAVVKKLKDLSKLIIIFTATANHPSLTPNGIMLANIAMAVNLAKLISGLKCRQVIYLSSVDVYGRKNLKLPISEENRIKPESPYAASKFISELIITAECSRQNIPAVILRLPGVYGSGDNSNRIIPSVIGSLRTGAVLKIKGDGKQQRDLLYAGDIARLADRIIRHPLSGTFNAVTGKMYSINEIIRMTENIAGKKLQRKYQRARNSQSDLYFGPSLILRHLRGFSFTPLLEGLRLTLNEHP